MWCGVDQPTGRSQPGQRQPRSRCWSARRVAGETVRVARPTSTTTESASSTRDMVQSQAIRSTVLPEICPELVLQTLQRGGQRDVRPHAFAAWQPAFVQVVVEQ